MKFPFLVVLSIVCPLLDGQKPTARTDDLECSAMKSLWPTGLAVDAEFLYWSDPFTVYVAGKDASLSQARAVYRVSQPDHVNSLHINHGFLYILRTRYGGDSATSTILRLPTNAWKPVEQLAKNISQTLDFHVSDADAVFWMGACRGEAICSELQTLRRGAVVTVARATIGSDIGALTTDGGDVFWIGTAHQVMKLDSNGNSAPVCKVCFGLRLTQDATHLYFSDGFGINRISKRGGAQEVVLPNLPNTVVSSITVDDEFVYVAGADRSKSPLQGLVGRVRKTGGSLNVIQRIAQPNSIENIAVDSTSLYFNGQVAGTDSASVCRMPKPAASAQKNR